jgi:hypothetical protein
VATSRFQEQLAQQLQFIKNSCDAYDRGEKGEAIRIATCVRILMHDTKNSTSLLTHLGTKNISFRTGCSVFDGSPTNTFVFEGLCLFTGAGVLPKLDRVAAAYLSADEWWHQLIAIPARGIRVTRESIVLTVANKDGGAHIDEKLPEEYEFTKRGSLVQVSGLGASGMKTIFMLTGGAPVKAEGNVRPVSDQHLLYLRQIGFEVLNSPELVKLTGLEAHQ